MKYFIAFIGLLYISGCYKKVGAEDPKASFRSRERRVVNTWKLKQKFIKGKEIDISEITQNLEIKEDGNYKLVSYNAKTYQSDNEYGTWDFLMNNDTYKTKERLVFNNIGFQYTDIFQIVKLSNKELIIQDINPDHFYDTTLEKLIYVKEK